jgi:hypothetical protein
MNTLFQQSSIRKPLELALLGITLLASASSQSSSFYKCQDGGELDAKEKAEITRASLHFAETALAGDMDAAYGQLTAAAKATISREQLPGILNTVESVRPFGDFRVEQITTVTAWAIAPTGRGMAICSKDASHPEKAVTVIADGVPEQAYVAVSAKSQSNRETWITTIWLIPSDGKWAVHSFHTTSASVLGKTANDYLSMARKEKAHGHVLNAGILYSGALSLAVRGPFYHTGIEDIIQRESQELTPPAEFRGQAPFMLSTPTGRFSILRLNPLPLDGKLYLLISHEVRESEESQQIEAENRGLITAFSKKFPEYSDAFAGIAAEALTPNHSHELRTLKENDDILAVH